MPVAPSELLVGKSRPHWTPGEVSGPFGRLICAICPGEVPEAAVTSLTPREQEFALGLEPESRRREWIGGRVCLASAIAHFSSARLSMLPRQSGAPFAPAGIGASISHKGPLALALAVETPGGVGVDVEYVAEHDGALEKKVLTAGERARFEARTEFAATQYVTVHFAMKEAIYKALAPTEQAELEFKEIALEFPVLTPGVWLEVSATLLTRPSVVRAAVLLDGAWMIAAALRDASG